MGSGSGSGRICKTGSTKEEGSKRPGLLFRVEGSHQSGHDWLSRGVSLRRIVNGGHGCESSRELPAPEQRLQAWYVHVRRSYDVIRTPLGR